MFIYNEKVVVDRCGLGLGCFVIPFERLIKLENVCMYGTHFQKLWFKHSESAENEYVVFIPFKREAEWNSKLAAICNLNNE